MKFLSSYCLNQWLCNNFLLKKKNSYLENVCRIFLWICGDLGALDHNRHGQSGAFSRDGREYARLLWTVQREKSRPKRQNCLDHPRESVVFDTFLFVHRSSSTTLRRSWQYQHQLGARLLFYDSLFQQVKLKNQFYYYISEYELINYGPIRNLDHLSIRCASRVSNAWAIGKTFWEFCFAVRMDFKSATFTLCTLEMPSTIGIF